MRIGGLFGGRAGGVGPVLPWTGAQQAAFLVLTWQMLSEAVAECTEEWAESLRQPETRNCEGGSDPAFSGPSTLLNSDTGVHGVLAVTNDLCFTRADDLRLDGWWPSLNPDPDPGATNVYAVTVELQALRVHTEIVTFIAQVVEALSRYDWRTSSATGLSDEKRVSKLVFRGSGGYAELRRQLLAHLANAPDPLGQAARSVMAFTARG